MVEGASFGRCRASTNSKVCGSRTDCLLSGSTLNCVISMSPSAPACLSGQHTLSRPPIFVTDPRVGTSGRSSSRRPWPLTNEWTAHNFYMIGHLQTLMTASWRVIFINFHIILFIVHVMHHVRRTLQWGDCED